MKLELAGIGPAQARKAARYLTGVVGRAHARQLDDATRKRWRDELGVGQTRVLDAPPWLWRSVVDLVRTHEKGYLDHCRQFALSTKKARQAE